MTTWSRVLLTGFAALVTVAVFSSVIATEDLAPALPALGAGVLALLVMPSSVKTRDADLAHVVAGSVDPRTGKTSKSRRVCPTLDTIDISSTVDIRETESGTVIPYRSLTVVQYVATGVLCLLVVAPFLILLMVKGWQSGGGALILLFLGLVLAIVLVAGWSLASVSRKILFEIHLRAPGAVHSLRKHGRQSLRKHGRQSLRAHGGDRPISSAGKLRVSAVAHRVAGKTLFYLFDELHRHPHLRGQLRGGQIVDHIRVIASHV